MNNNEYIQEKITQAINQAEHEIDQELMICDNSDEEEAWNGEIETRTNDITSMLRLSEEIESVGDDATEELIDLIESVTEDYGVSIDIN